MSATTWTVDVDGARHTISVERDAQMGRSMIRVDGRMAAKPMSDEEGEREVPVGSMRYVVRRVGEDKFELDVPPEVFLNPTTSKLRSRRQTAEPSESGGRKIGLYIAGFVVVAIVTGLLRVGRDGFSYMRVPWKPYDGADGTFKVLFAGDPTQRTQTLNINGDLWKIVSLQSRHKNHIYTVEYVDARMVITEQNAPAIIDDFLQGWMTAISATVVNKEQISLARNPAVSFTARIPKGAGEGEDKLEVDARQRGIMALRNNRIFVAWTLAAERDPISWDLQKFLESFEIEPPEERPTTLASVYAPAPAAAAPATEAKPSTAPPPPQRRPLVEMTTPVERVYAYNRTKKFYPADCAARPEGAYAIAKSLAIRQGFTLAEECAR
ncbi:MAG TPA: hypothetical protein VNA04_12500 [Thermoanaerobaculia bacterium]|nr:hypothetical protein [Thermoanaerobaculia bacterium]